MQPVSFNQNLAEQPSEFTVITWNILLDKTRTAQGLIAPQSDRLNSHIITLGALPVDLDVITLQEVEKTPQVHNGEVIAQNLGYSKGFWFEHNTSKRRGEHIGFFGKLVSSVEAFDVGHDKKAVITYIGDVAIVGIHHRRELWGKMRTEQMEAVIDKVSDMERVVIAGDANALSFEKSRRLLRRADFLSAFAATGQPQPKTHPTKKYADIIHNSWQQKVFPQGKSLDIIEARGVEVKAAGTFSGDSDHIGCYATIYS